MTTQLSISGIAGSDGITPIYQPNARWTIWNLSEIYLGQQGESRYVPNVKDYVVNPDTNEYRKVVSIDPTTMIPVLVNIISANVGALSTEDVLLGVGPGTQSDTYRVYIDQSVLPHTLAVDARLSVAGTMVRSAKIFKGSELSGNQKVISAFYDQSGNLLGQSIPLELVAMANGQNFSIQTVPVCYTVEDLVDGEVVTAVFYSDTGHVVSKRQLLVENTAFIRSTDVGVKYITAIALESPFLSHSDPKLIQYPMNVPLPGLGLMGVVHYSDGSLLRMPVDGTKFSIFGFEGYVATIVGQKFPLVLKYNLAADEVVYGANVGNGKFMSESFKATTIKADGAFTVKLFGYPVWVSAVEGYRMEWYLYSLERKVVYNVTPWVRFNANTHLFNPTAYGVNQNLSVTINLKDVNGIFVSYNHVQSIDIALAGPGTDRQTNWTIGFDPNQDPEFGIGNFASTTFVNQNLMKVKLDAGALTKADWLERLYYRTKPLIDTSTEAKAIEPNYFALIVNGQSIEFPIAQWNTELTLTTVLPNSGTLFIKFFKRTVDNDISLAMSAMPIYQTN